MEISFPLHTLETRFAVSEKKKICGSPIMLLEVERETVS